MRDQSGVILYSLNIRTIEKYERIIVPLVFILLGLYIMYENGTIETFLTVQIFLFHQDFIPSSNWLSDFQRAFYVVTFTSIYSSIIFGYDYQHCKTNYIYFSHLVPLLKIWYTFHENFLNFLRFYQRRFACFPNFLEADKTSNLCYFSYFARYFRDFSLSSSFNGICCD